MRDAVRHILLHCGSLKPGESVLVISDETTLAMAAAFVEEAEHLDANADTAIVPVAAKHGKEPPPEVAACMRKYQLILGLTKMSLAHTQARLEATAGGGRYLSLPGYTIPLLADPCIRANYRAQLPITRAVTEAFTKGQSARVRNQAGTDVHLDIRGRRGNCCPGYVDDEWRLGSPPDIESNVSPVEDGSEGVIVVDGSVACEEVGLVRSPVILTVRRGRIVSFGCDDRRHVVALEQLFASVQDPKAYVLAECGVGLNPAARLTGNMLTDEGAMGCVHFGFGSNATVGGMNDVAFHLDFVVRTASLWIDDSPVLIDGEPCLSGNPK